MKKDLILQEAIQNFKQRGVDCCWQDYLVKIKLFSGKNLENPSNYCGLIIGTECRI